MRTIRICGQLASNENGSHLCARAVGERSLVPMVVGVNGQAVCIAADDATGLLEALLVAVVARFAERLPVALVPEQLLFAMVRDDVVDHRGRLDHAPLHVELAQRIALQECFSLAPPPATVEVVVLIAALKLAAHHWHRVASVAQCAMRGPQYARDNGWNISLCPVTGNCPWFVFQFSTFRWPAVNP